MNTGIFSDFIFLSALILLGFGLLASTVTFSVEHLYCRWCARCPPRYVSTLSSEDCVQIALATAVTLPSALITVWTMYMFIRNYDNCPYTFMLYDWTFCGVDTDE